MPIYTNVYNKSPVLINGILPKEYGNTKYFAEQFAVIDYSHLGIDNRQGEIDYCLSRFNMNDVKTFFTLFKLFHLDMIGEGWRTVCMFYLLPPIVGLGAASV